MADPTDTSTRLTPAEFVRMLRFIRLWKKTGWTIEQTDAAICALFNADLRRQLSTSTRWRSSTPDSSRCCRASGIVMRVMDALNLNVDARPAVAAGLLGADRHHGDNALYRQMFLNPAMLSRMPCSPTTATASS